MQNKDTHVIEFITKGSYSLLFKMLGAIAALGNNVLIARFFGLNCAGLYYLSVGAIFVFSVFGRAGQDERIIRDFSVAYENNDKSKLNEIYFSKLILLLVFTIVSWVTYILILHAASMFSWLQPELIDAMHIVGWALIPMNILALHCSLLKAIRAIKTASFFVGFAPHVVSIPIYALFAILGAKGNTFLWTFVFMHWLLMGLTVWVSWKKLKFCWVKFIWPKIGIDRRDVFFFLIGITEIINQNVLLWIVNFSSTLEQVGGLGIVFKLLVLFNFLPEALNAIFAPKTAVLFHSNQKKGLKRITKRYILIVMSLSFPLFAAYQSFPEYILLHFTDKGEEFAIYLSLFSWAYYLQLIFGPVTQLLSMSKFESVYFYCNLFTLMLGTCLALLYIGQYGLITILYCTTLMVLLNRFLLWLFVMLKREEFAF